MKDALLFYGNCQAGDMARLAKHIPCIADAYEVKFISSYESGEDRWETQHDAAFMRNISVVWEQVETGVLTPNRRALYERLPPGARRIKFPALSILCLWPFAGGDRRQASEAQPRYTLADSVAARLAAAEGTDDELFARYMETTTRMMPNLTRRLDMDLRRWRERDAISDLQVGEWVASNFRLANLFHTWSHITGPAIRYLLERLSLETFGAQGASSEHIRGAIRCILQDHAGQDFVTLPIHPLVAERLELRFYDPAARYRWEGHLWTFEEYIIHYIRWRPFMRH